MSFTMSTRAFKHHLLVFRYILYFNNTFKIKHKKMLYGKEMHIQANTAALLCVVHCHFLQS